MIIVKYVKSRSNLAYLRSWVEKLILVLANKLTVSRAIYLIYG